MRSYLLCYTDVFQRFNILVMGIELTNIKIIKFNVHFLQKCIITLTLLNLILNLLALLMTSHSHVSVLVFACGALLRIVLDKLSGRFFKL